MLPINILQDTVDPFTMLLPLLLCCMLPMLFRQPSQPQETSDSDSWYVTYGIQDAYDAVVKETDEWRERAALKKSRSMFSLFSRKKRASFIIDQAVPPRLYRVKDEEVGNISFELMEVEGGGTSIKSTYDSRGRALIQNFKAKMPVRIPASGPKNCPTCGKEMMPDFKACPYCGTKIR